MQREEGSPFGLFPPPLFIAPILFLLCFPTARLTKGRAKARQRKMHQIAQLLELPGNVAPGCPSPPSLNLHSLRKEAAAQSN